MTDKASQTTNVTANTAEELLKRADTIGAWLQGKIDPAVDFATQQAVDIAQQYVMFGMAYQTFISVGCILVFIASIWLAKKFWEVTRGHILVLTAVVGVWAWVCFCTTIRDTLLVWFAPKVWLLTQLAELVKSAK